MELILIILALCNVLTAWLGANGIVKRDAQIRVLRDGLIEIAAKRTAGANDTVQRMADIAAYTLEATK